MTVLGEKYFLGSLVKNGSALALMMHR